MRAIGVIDHKLKKVTDLRTDAPAIRESLESLSTFYGHDGNTLESRRALRAGIEAEGLRLATAFIDSFSGIEERFNKLYGQVEELNNGCTRVSDRLEQTHARTSEFLAKTQAMQAKRVALSKQAEVVSQFLARFQLSDEETAAIHTQPLERDGGRQFFAALQRVESIRAECQKLLSDGSHSAGLEIYESMAQHQQVAHERLYLWVQQKCPDVDSEMPDTQTSVLLRRALLVLRQRPAYYKHCQDIVTNTRRTMLARRFVDALTRGGPNGTPRPIEVHAHDAQRYAGDMLAWVHQAVATERELVTAYFGELPKKSPGAGGNEAGSTPRKAQSGAGGGAGAGAGDGSGDADASGDGAGGSSGDGGGGGDGGSGEGKAGGAVSGAGVIREVLSHVFEGVATPLKVRLLQALSARTSLLTSFKLVDLMAFYEEMVGGLLLPDMGLAKAISHCRKAAREHFEAQLKSQGQKLVNSPPPYAADLSPSSTVQDVVARLQDILRVMQHSMVPPDEREEAATPIIAAFLDPLLRMCRLSAEGLDTTDTCVYLINNITAMQTALVPFSFAAGWVQRLAQELERWEEALVSEQTRSILQECAITAKLGAIATHDGSVPLSAVEGMDLASLGDSLKVFYSALFELEIGAFERLLNGRLRDRAQHKVAQLLATAYQKLHDAVTDPANGYDGADSLLLHAPEQVRNLLDLD